MKTFSGAAARSFVAPSAIEAGANSHYGAQVVGRINGNTESFYAISVERRLKHLAVIVLRESARDDLLLLSDAAPEVTAKELFCSVRPPEKHRLFRSISAKTSIRQIINIVLMWGCEGESRRPK